MVFSCRFHWFHILDEVSWMATTLYGSPHLHVVNIYVLGYGNKVLDLEKKMIEV